MESGEIRYCIRCGTRLAQAERFGGLRPTCLSCGWVYFADPKVAAAVLVEKDGQVLLVRRANDPLRGLWTLPAGFVDAGEDPRRAAERECFEETGLHVQVERLLEVMYGKEHPRGAHIILFYRAALIEQAVPDQPLQAADDVDRAAFFPLDALPVLAFKTTEHVLSHYRNVDGATQN